MFHSSNIESYYGNVKFTKEDQREVTMKIEDLDDYELYVLITNGSEDLGMTMNSDMGRVEIGTEAKRIVDRLGEFVDAYQVRVATGATVHRLRPKLATDTVQ